jgi:uncharacterized lipoprotein
MRHALTICSLLVVLAVAGCSSSRTPLRTESSTSSISAAEAVGAIEVPRAALHLQLAKENLERANVLAAKGKDKEAASLLQRAEVDAELAILLSKEQHEIDEAAQAMERVHRLQQPNK